LIPYIKANGAQKARVLSIFEKFGLRPLPARSGWSVPLNFH